MEIQSLLLQMSLYFNSWYLLIFYLFEIILLIAKGLSLPYPARNFIPELILLVFLSLIDGVRSFLGMKGNLTKRRLPLLVSLVFLVPIFAGYLYFILWQTYILTIELPVVIIAYIGVGLHLLLSVFVLWSIQRNIT